MASACSEKKAHDIVIVDMKKMSGVCDYFVIAGGSSTTQVRAIADHIAEVLEKKGQPIHHIEGEGQAHWILLDAVDVVAHIFLDQTRRFYDLERLWAHAPLERFREVAGKLRPAPAKKKGAKSKRPAKKARRAPNSRKRIRRKL